MNPFKPKRTFESVVRELVAGLEDGTIILNKEAGAPQSEKQTGAIIQLNNPLATELDATSSERENRGVSGK